MLAAVDFLLLYVACSTIEMFGMQAFVRAVLKVFAVAAAGIIAAALYLLAVGPRQCGAFI